MVAETALDRLACALGGKTMLPQIVSNIPKMLANPDWKSRHAALMAISSVGEGCHKQMEAMLPQIMDGVLNFLQDPVRQLVLLQFYNFGFIASSCTVRCV